MLVEELLRCQIREWYPIFEPHTFPTLFVPLPLPFRRYLLGLPPQNPNPNPNPNPINAINDDHNDDDDDDDAPPPPPPPLFLLPRSSAPLPRPSPSSLDPLSLLDSSFPPEDDDDDGDDDGDAPSFPELEAAVERAIAELGGAALPKLNWSAPKDAAWIAADGSLRCASFADAALLLRASDSAAHDLSLALPSCSDHDPRKTPPDSDDDFYYLALRKWKRALRPEMEFRCFARRRCLLAVSQRDATAFYPALIDRRREILAAIRSFFDSVVAPRFASEDYTVDVYVMRDMRVRIVDFNPWGAFTLPLLFTWEELEQREVGDEDVEVEIRVLESQCGVRPGLKTAVPYDYLDTGEGSGWDEFLRNAEEEIRRQARWNSQNSQNSDAAAAARD